MKIFYSSKIVLHTNSVIAFGKFDAMHEGHIKLIKKVVYEAKKDNLLSIIYTFNHNPNMVLSDKEVTPLLSMQDKISRLEGLGIDVLIIEDFTIAYSKISSYNFVKKILQDRLNAKKVVMGSNSRFGNNAEGDIALMKKIGNICNIEVIEEELLRKNGKVVSSTSIREELEKDEIL